MGRAAKPWYRKDRDAWYVNVQGKRIKLVDGKSNRIEAYRRFLAINPEEQQVATARVTGQEVCDLFLQYARTNLKPKTYEGYKRFLEPFGRHVGVIDGNEVQPKHVTKFLDQRPTWGKTTRFNAITAIKRAWSWANDEGHLTLNQLSKLKKPRPNRREEIPNDHEIERFLSAAKPERVFGNLGNLGRGEPPGHDVDHGQMDHCFGCAGVEFIVLAHPPKPSQPCKGAFHDPATRQELESLDVVASLHDL